MRAFRSSLAKNSPGKPDLRVHSREPVNRRAKVLEGPYTLDAVVKNISFGGARVAFAARTPGSDQVILIDQSLATAYLCRVVWRKGAECGVEFIKTQDLRGLVPGQFDAAKRLWQASAR